MSNKGHSEQTKANFKRNFQMLCIRRCKKELLERMNVTEQSLSQYKNGAMMPSIENLIIIADYFGVTVDRLIRPISNDEEE